jgi:hypothetical protein
MLMSLGIDSRLFYAQEFEVPFLLQSAEFYRVCLLGFSYTLYSISTPLFRAKVKNY